MYILQFLVIEIIKSTAPNTNKVKYLVYDIDSSIFYKKGRDARFLFRVP